MQREKFEKEWFKDDLIIENETAYCVYDQIPVSLGHCLIIPHKHIKSFFELDEFELSQIYQLIKKAKDIIQQKFNPDGYNIGINEGQSAGRSVQHLHIHIIPRYEGDVINPRGGIRNIIPGKGDYTKTFKR